MASVRVIPILEDARTIEQLAVLNTLTLVNPEQSMWTAPATSDISVGYGLFSRSGSRALKIATDTVDPPPIIDWTYDDSSSTDAVVTLDSDINRSPLRVKNLEIVPNPADNFPDTYWTRNGLDLIPRS